MNRLQRNGNGMSIKKLFVVQTAVLLLLFIVALCTGRFELSFDKLIQVILGQGSITENAVLWQIRLPRAILATVSGAALSLTGSAMQKMFGNPLASPDIMGVTSGCSAGAAIGILIFGGGSFLVQGFAFIGGMGALAFALFVARLIRTQRTAAFILAGIVTGAVSTALIMSMKYFADPLRQLPAIDFWLMGGFHGADWKQVISAAPLAIICGSVLCLMGWKLQVLSYGEEQANSLGISVKHLRGAVIVLTGAAVASVISVSGLISFIGLISPHIVRLYCRENYKAHLPLSAMTGASLLLLADTVAKSLASSEIPISIVTTLIGVPVLLYLAAAMGRKSMKNGQHI